jgi:DNA-binding beta-propeller fold protein YncE
VADCVGNAAGLQASINNPASIAMHPSGQYAYIGTGQCSNYVVKLTIASNSVSYILSTEIMNPSSMVFDSTGTYLNVTKKAYRDIFKIPAATMAYTSASLSTITAETTILCVEKSSDMQLLVYCKYSTKISIVMISSTWTVVSMTCSAAIPSMGTIDVDPTKSFVLFTDGSAKILKLDLSTSIVSDFITCATMTPSSIKIFPDQSVIFVIASGGELYKYQCTAGATLFIQLQTISQGLFQLSMVILDGPLPCSPGSYGATCTLCNAGAYSNAWGSDSCSPCNAPTYASWSGSSSC